MPSGQIEDEIRSQRVTFFVQRYIKFRERAEVRLQRSFLLLSPRPLKMPLEGCRHEAESTPSVLKVGCTQEAGRPLLTSGLEELLASPEKRACPPPPQP